MVVFVSSKKRLKLVEIGSKNVEFRLKKRLNPWKINENNDGYSSSNNIER